jgi:hypothetical protein
MTWRAISARPYGGEERGEAVVHYGEIVMQLI